MVHAPRASLTSRREMPHSRNPLCRIVRLAGPVLGLAVLSSCGRTAPAGAPPSAAPPAFAPRCEMDNLRAMTARRSCPEGGSSPAAFAAADLDGPVLPIDPARGFAIVEAETLPGARRPRWQSGDSRAFPEFGEGAAGGFVMWLGGQCTGEENLQDPPPHTRQGHHQDWLVLKFEVPPGHEGRYQLMLRTSHRLHDGDNDLWAGLVGEQGPIKRAGFGPAGRFTWNKGPAADLGAGTHAFYVAGRSACMGIDRLAVVKAGAVGETALETAAASP